MEISIKSALKFGFTEFFKNFLYFFRLLLFSFASAFLYLIFPILLVIVLSAYTKPFLKDGNFLNLISIATITLTIIFAVFNIILIAYKFYYESINAGFLIYNKQNL